MFYSLIDSAEEEEFKEAILAYYFIYISEEAISEEFLDERIENWFRYKYNCTLDFECSDALAKLKRLKLLKIDDIITLQVVKLDEALKILDSQWDNYFTYN